MSQLRNSIIANLEGGTPPTPPTPIDDGIMKITVRTVIANQAFAFNASNVSDYVVDWGNGTVTTGIASNRYSTAGTYHVEIKRGVSGNFPVITFVQIDGLVSIDSPIPYMLNGTDLSNFVCVCQDFESIDENAFYFNPQITKLDTGFTMSKLTSISPNLFKPLVNLTSAKEIFSGTKLTSLPEGLFDYNTQLTNLQKAFNNCTDLATVPDNLLRNNTALTNLSYLFYNCQKLVIPQNLFCNEATEKTTRFANVSGVNFNSAFWRSTYSGSGTMTVPELWDYTYGTTPTKTSCFGGSGNSTSNITNYSSIPSAWGGPAA